MTATETRTPLFKVGDPAIVVSTRSRPGPAQQGTVVKVGRRWATVEIAYGPDGKYKNEYQIDKFDGAGKEDARIGWAYHKGYTPETLVAKEARDAASSELRALMRFNWTEKLTTEQIVTIVDLIKGSAG